MSCTRTSNIFLLSFSFMLIFASFKVCLEIEERVTITYRKEAQQNNDIFKGKGYTSLAILYAVFAISKWFGPFISDFLGVKLSCLVAGACYCFYMASFIHPFIETIYIAAAVTGIGAGVIWSAQASIVLSSTDTKHSKRDGRIFWGFMQFSRLVGNIFLVLTLKDTKTIGEHHRTLIFTVLASACGLGTLLLLLIFPPKFLQDPQEQEKIKLNTEETSLPGDKTLNPFKIFHQSMRMFFNSIAVPLVFIFIYTGFAFAFYSSTFMTCIGNIKYFDNPDGYIGIAGIALGIGEIIGGSIFGIAGEKKLCGRKSIISVGIFFHLFAYGFIFLNIPFESTLGETSKNAFWGEPSMLMAATCAFFLGLGGSCTYSQIYALLGKVFEADSPLVFEVFTFIQSLSIAGFYLLTGSTNLFPQLMIVVAVGIFGVLTYYFVEWRINSQAKREL